MRRNFRLNKIKHLDINTLSYLISKQSINLLLIDDFENMKVDIPSFIYHHKELSGLVRFYLQFLRSCNPEKKHSHYYEEMKKTLTQFHLKPVDCFDFYIDEFISDTSPSEININSSDVHSFHQFKEFINTFGENLIPREYLDENYDSAWDNVTPKAVEFKPFSSEEDRLYYLYQILGWNYTFHKYSLYCKDLDIFMNNTFNEDTLEVLKNSVRQNYFDIVTSGEIFSKPTIKRYSGDFDYCIEFGVTCFNCYNGEFNATFENFEKTKSGLDNILKFLRTQNNSDM